jgi:catechol 2,3-dioxygenase-like lactoylglutathione lyase family enzyme
MNSDLEVVEMANSNVGGFVLAKEILSVFVYVKDLEKSKQWYSEVLGLNFGGFDGNRTNQLGVGLVLFEKENFSPCSESLFVIQTSNLEESYNKLKELRVEVSEINREINCFNLKDLDGNVITVWQ